MDLPDGKVPVLEVVDAPNGNRYGLFASIYSLDGGPAVTAAGFEELELSQPEATSDAGQATAGPPEPVNKIDPRLLERVAAGDKTISVSIWPTEELVPPLFLELQKAVLRGDVLTRGEKAALHERRSSSRSDKQESRFGREPIVARLRQLGARVTYRCSNSPWILARLPAAAIEAIAKDADIALAELREGAEVPSSSGGTVAAASQLHFYPNEGFDGEGGSAVQDEIMLSLIEADFGPNDEHVGFKDGPTSNGPRFKSRTGIVGDNYDDDMTITSTSNFPDANENDHATGVLGIALGDLRDGQDPSVPSTMNRRNLSGYANEAEAHVFAVTGHGAVPVALDLIQSKTPLTHVVNLSLGFEAPDEPDPNCNGTELRSRMVNDLFETGMFVVKSADDFGHVSASDCRVGSPASAIVAFTVGGYGVGLEETVTALRARPFPTTRRLAEPTDARSSTWWRRSVARTCSPKPAATATLIAVQASLHPRPPLWRWI